jgi:hypothetical protein
LFAVCHLSSSLVSGAWTRTGQGTASTTGHYSSDYDGSGVMSLPGPYSSTLTNTEHESGFETSSYSSSATQSLGTDGNWTLNAGGTGVSMDSVYSSSSYSGSGTYSHVINNSGVLANGIQKYTHTDSCDTSNQMSSYHFQPSWGETVDNTGVHSTAYADNGTITATSSDGTSTTTVASCCYSVHPVGFAGSPALADPVTGPTFGPANGDAFGYEATVPPPSEPQPIPPPQQPMGPSWWEATKALAGQADPSVQTKFNQSVSDRSLGTVSAFVAAGTGGLITHVGGQPYDPENFASAQQFAGGVIAVESALLPAGAALDSGIASGGLARMFSGAGEEAAGDGAALGTTASEGNSLAGQVGCFRAGTLVLTNGGRIPVEQVELGQRVLTAPEGREDSSAAIRSPDYRVVHLRYVEPGSGHAMDLEFLRHKRMLDGLGAGDTVRLSALELEFDGRATVLSVKPAPFIHGGSGRLVTGTIRSRNRDVRLLKLAGLERPIEVTGSHPVFSHDRGRFVSVGELKTGERLRTRSNVAEVVCVTPLCGEYLVFNLEVDAVHRYYVSELDVLVHNTCVDDALNATMSHGDQFLDGSVTNPNFTNPGGALSSDGALEAAERWLGDNYSQAAGGSPGAGAGIFRSAPDANGMVRQFRMTGGDLTGAHGTIGPHFHLQLFDSRGFEIANNHIPLV